MNIVATSGRQPRVKKRFENFSDKKQKKTKKQHKKKEKNAGQAGRWTAADQGDPAAPTTRKFSYLANISESV
jgi:hypothetical protein